MESYEVALPRRGSRVRIPSRALTFKESLETGVPFVLYTNVYRKTGKIKRPCGLEFFRGSGDSFKPPKVL